MNSFEVAWRDVEQWRDESYGYCDEDEEPDWVPDIVPCKYCGEDTLSGVCGICESERMADRG